MRKKNKSVYSGWFAVPTLIIYVVIFLIPLICSLFFSLTVWDFDGFRFIGLENFRMFFSENSLRIGLRNTPVYAVCTCAAKVVLGFFTAVFLNSGIRSKNFLRATIFFPHLVSTIATGITFRALMHPSKGLFNLILQKLGFPAVDWLGNIHSALFSVIGVDIWKGLGIVTVIYIAGLQAIDKTYYEAAEIDGASAWQKLKMVTFPLIRPSMNSVIILQLVSGMRWFDLIWSMTEGGPGFATDVLSSIVYKQYVAGYYGLSTAGNVIMFALISIIIFPLQKYLLSKEEE